MAGPTATRWQRLLAKAKYEATSATFKGGAWICGRTTMQEILGDDEPFVSVSNQPAGPQPAHVARRAESYAVAVDTLGKLQWTGSSEQRGKTANRPRPRGVR